MLGGQFWLRLSLVAAQLATLIITRPLWMTRVYNPADADPQQPVLPLLPLPQCDVFWPLVASLVAVIVWPRVGVWLHAALLAIAMLMDQFRVQPQVVSLAILMIATLPGQWPPLVGRSQLIAMWFYAGWHKLISPGFYQQTVPFLLSPFLGERGNMPAESTAYAIGFVLALGEGALAILVLFPKTRRIGAVLGATMHLMLVFWLSRMIRFNGQPWNEAIWPWNVGLAVAAVALFWRWDSTLWADFRHANRWTKTAVAVLLIMPLGYYFGLVDAYFAHCLYSCNLPTAYIRLADNRNAVMLSDIIYRRLNVPLPPTHPIYEAYFRAVGEPGETLVIDDPRQCAKWFGYAHREIKADSAVGP